MKKLIFVGVLALMMSVVSSFGNNLITKQPITDLTVKNTFEDDFWHCVSVYHHTEYNFFTQTYTDVYITVCTWYEI